MTTRRGGCAIVKRTGNRVHNCDNDQTDIPDMSAEPAIAMRLLVSSMRAKTIDDFNCLALTERHRKDRTDDACPFHVRHAMRRRRCLLMSECSRHVTPTLSFSRRRECDDASRISCAAVHFYSFVSFHAGAHARRRRSQARFLFCALTKYARIGGPPLCSSPFRIRSKRFPTCI